METGDEFNWQRPGSRPALGGGLLAATTIGIGRCGIRTRTCPTPTTFTVIEEHRWIRQRQRPTGDWRRC